jgi:hypothetical protein
MLGAAFEQTSRAWFFAGWVSAENLQSAGDWTEEHESASVGVVVPGRLSFRPRIDDGDWKQVVVERRPSAGRTLLFSEECGHRRRLVP